MEDKQGGVYGFLDPDVHMPERFGFFKPPKNGEKPGATSYTLENTDPELYTTKYRAYHSTWKQSIGIPFGISLLDVTGSKTYGIVLDFDKHYVKDKKKLLRSDKEMADYYGKLLPILQRFNFATEDSGGETGGYKSWMLFDEPTEVSGVLPFCSYLEKDFDDMGLEVFPRGGYWTRLPGLYKTRDRYSLVLHSSRLETGTELNTFEKINEFFIGAKNDPDEF